MPNSRWKKYKAKLLDDCRLNGWKIFNDRYMWCWFLTMTACDARYAHQHIQKCSFSTDRYLPWSGYSQPICQSMRNTCTADFESKVVCIILQYLGVKEKVDIRQVVIPWNTEKDGFSNPIKRQKVEYLKTLSKISKISKVIS